MIWRPWREARRLRERIKHCHSTIDYLNTALAEHSRNLADARRQLDQARQAAMPTEPQASYSTGAPEFIMVGVDREGRGKRLIASREPRVLAFGMTDESDPPPRWKIEAALANALFIDGASYSEGMSRLEEIWRNWERDQRERDRPAIDAILGIDGPTRREQLEYTDAHDGLLSSAAKAELERLRAADPPKEITDGR